MSEAHELKPCPFCGGDAILTGSVVDRSIMYAHCRDHKCPGWTVSRINTRYWNTRAAPTLSEAMQVPDVRALVEAMLGLKSIVEGIDGAMNHGTWRDEKGMRLKDTSEWVSAYNAIAAFKEPRT